MVESRKAENAGIKQPVPKGDLRDGVRKLILKTLIVLGATYWRHANLASIFVLAGFTAIMLALAQFHPVYNWDSLAYLAAAARDRIDEAAQLHSYAYAALRDAVPAKDFIELTQADAYRIRQFTDPNAFVSMLGMYEVKWLYVQLMRWLVPIFGPLGAADAINGAALVIMNVSVCLWLRSTRLSVYAPLVVPLLFMLQFQGFAVTQQPDFLANSLLIAALLCYDRERDLLGSAFLLITVLVRPDQAALAGVLMACAWFLRDRNTLLFALTFITCVAAWMLTSRSVHSVGWWPHFWFSTYQIQNDMTDFKPDFSAKVYLYAIALNLYRSFFQNTWLAAYVIALAWGGFIYFRPSSQRVRRQVLLLAMLLAIAAKFVIFPLHDGRIYFTPLFVFFLIGVAHWREQDGSDALKSRSD